MRSDLLLSLRSAPTLGTLGVPRRRGLAVAVLLAAALLPLPTATQAVEVPPTGAAFTIQTNGPGAPVTLGDWYTSTEAGAGAGYHYLQFDVPCSWPTSEAISVDIFSAELNADAAAIGDSEEAAGSLDDTEFELYGPGVTPGPSPAQPAPGAGTFRTIYPPAPTGQPEAWQTFATLSPATCGSYTVRAETKGDDQNGWRLRVGADTDGNVTTPPIDDWDGVPGTDDELVIGIASASYQHDAGGRVCFDLYEVVAPGTASMRVNNFDYDLVDIPGSQVNYHAPSGALTPGTISSPTATWNGSNTITRGGDLISAPEPGWWRFNSCVSDHNQFIQEGTHERLAYYEQPPTPQLTVAKDDGRVLVGPSDVLTYDVTVANTASGPTAGAATNVVATDTLPTGTAFVSCSFVAPATGACSAVGNVVTGTLDGSLDAGSTTVMRVVAQVAPAGAPTTLTNTVVVSFDDSYGNPFSPVSATDVDRTGSNSIGDLVWSDTNADGVRDAGEPGLPGVRVRVDWFGPDGVAGGGDDATTAEITGPGGAYLADGLPDGNYRVRVLAVDAPAGALPTAGAAGYLLTLAAGSSVLTADFGFTGTGSVGDLVWLDSDADGVQQPGEPGLAGVDVSVVWAGPDGAFGSADDVTYATTTGTDGSYLVEDLPAGAYRVDVDTSDAPMGTTLVSGSDPTDFTLLPGQAYADADFGFAGSGSIGDQVWLDLDADGVADASEPGLSGVDVTVTWAGPDGSLGTPDDVLLPTVTSDVDGRYVVTGLPAGDFTVDVDTADAPAGTTLGAGADPTFVSLATGETHTGADFGFVGTGSIGDLVWLDRNGDGVHDPDEPGLAGVDVTVTWAGQDGIPSTSDDVTILLTTGVDGSYLAANLPAGAFVVDVDQTTAPAGTTLVSGSDPLAVTLADGESVLTADFGFGGTGSVGDLVWLDLNADGVRDLGEPGLAGVDVTVTSGGADGLLGTSDDLVTTTTTAADGSYLVTGLPAGPISVAVDESDSPGAPRQTTPGLLTYDLGAGEAYADADFAFAGTGSVGDLVWLDLDGDGTAGETEPGIGGVDLSVTWFGPDGLLGTADDITLTTTTGSDGSYVVSDLPAGAYRVDVDEADAPPGTVLTSETDPTDVTVVPGAQADADFGFGGTGTIGDLVWVDTDADGVQDAGEPGLAGADVHVVWVGLDGVAGTSDDISRTLTTDSDGAYRATGLPFGDYTVTVNAWTVAAGLELVSGTSPTSLTLDGTTPSRQDVDFGYRARADLELVKDLDGRLVDGKEATWTLTVSNVGGGPATGPITVVDELADELTFVSAEGGGFTCSLSGSTVTCTRSAALAAGATAVISLVTSVDAAVGSTVSNSATVSTPTVEGSTSNNDDSDSGLVQAGAVSRVPADGSDPTRAVRLPRTGGDIALLGLAASVLLGCGATLRFVTRRRRDEV